MTATWECAECGAPSTSAEDLAWHRINAHGVNRTRAFEQAGLRAPPRSGAPDGAGPASAIEVAARNLRRARLHAEIIEGLSHVLLILGMLGAAVVALSGVEYVVTAFVGAFSVLVSWALLKAVALHLHMTVDRIMIEGDDD